MEININKKIASNTKNIEVTGDIIVPDIKPDIVSIVNTNATCYIFKMEVSTGRIRVEGNIDAYVVYLADNGENRSIGTTLTFLENIDDPAIKENSYVKQKIFLDEIEAKVLNERKISITAKATIKSDVYEEAKLNIPEDYEKIENVQKLEESMDIKSLVGKNTVKTSIKEDISVDPSYNVLEILKVKIDLQNIENKISINKVLAKADANIKIIFLSDDGRIGKLDATLPIMSFIDIDKVTDSNICEVSYNIRNMLFKINSVDKHSINVQIDFEVNLEVYETKTINVIQDMYGIKNNIEFTKKDALVEVNSAPKDQKISLNERVIVEDVLNIYDTDTIFRIVGINEVGANYSYEAELDLIFYYEADSRNGLNVKTVTIPFNFKMDSKEDIEFKIINKEFTVNGENVDCNIDILVSIENNNTKNISIIENLEVTDLEEENTYNMYVYFVKPGDTAWSISKNFRVSKEELLTLNELENENSINVGDRLYIMR